MSAPRFTCASVTKALAAKGHPRVELIRGEGYLFFVFDDPARNIYDTRSVMVPRLGDLTLDQWVEDGVAFARDIEAHAQRGHYQGAKA